MRFSALGGSAFLVLVILGAATPTAAWIQQMEDENLGVFTSEAVAVGPNGDVVVGGVDGSGATADFSVVKLDGTSGGEIWRHASDGTAAGDNDAVRAIAVDGVGDVLAAGVLENVSTSLDFAVVKLDGATGAEIWRYTLDGTEDTYVHDAALDVTADASGDVIAIGNLSKPGVDGLAIVKLDRATGAELWRRQYPSAAWIETAAVAVDSNDDVVATGTRFVDNSNQPLLVVKIDGSSGVELWQRTFPGDGYAYDVVIEAADDAIVNGETGSNDNGSFVFAVLKLDGATGAEVWHYKRFAVGRFYGDTGDVLAVDAAGDVLATGRILSVTSLDPDPGFGVVKLDGMLGTQIWRTTVHGADPGYPHDPSAIVLHPTGDVFVAGTIRNDTTGDDGVLVRLDGTTGAEIWRHEVDGTEDSKTDQLGNDGFSRLATHPGGDPVAVGHISAKRPPHSFVTVRLDQDDGALEGFPGSKLLVKDPGDPAKRRVSFLIKDDLLQAPAPGSIYDPRVAGATFRIWNPTTLEEASFALPAESWLPIGTPPGVQGYRYKASAGSGPCTKATLRTHKKLSVTCKARSGTIPFTLDEPSQGSLAVSVKFGDLAPQCAEFGGLVIADEPGIFKSKAAPGLPACP